MIEMIVNPAAGGGRGVEIAKLAAKKLEELGHKFLLHTTNHPGHATEIARTAAERGAETVIAFGGDGTVHETAAGLRGTQTALGIIPSGTGNDFIKSAGIPTKWEDALSFILSHPARPVNSGMMNETFFLNECGTGFDVLTLDYANKAKKYVRGLLPYLYGVICSIFSYKPYDMRIEIGDDVVLDGKYLVCAIGNGRYIGGGIPITPGAELTDGMFDVLVVDAVPRWVIPFYLPSLMMGTLHKRKPAHLYHASSVRLSCNEMRLNMDGEVLPLAQAHIVCEEDKLLLHW
ncbi:MAG: diacylglycerol kinase family lipid kinase [Clostridia bacterium]|nr:diacylglycerol kinase family lipid kinase [Clostridia bacterium]